MTAPTHSSSSFSLALSDEDRRTLLVLARESILRHLADERAESAAGAHCFHAGPEESPVLEQPLGAFVTLRKNGQLRGCIGHLVGAGPLRETVARMACAAAFEDTRFPPLTVEEWEGVSVEISVLGPITLCEEPEAIRVGRHGLLVRQGGRSGLLLPQVPVEWGWDRETFLAQTCCKAGLSPEAWRNPGTELFWFEAEVF